MRNKVQFVILIAALTGELCDAQTYHGTENTPSSLAWHWIIFKEPAKGGSLYLFQTPVGRFSRSMPVFTHPGDSPGMVAELLSLEARQNRQFSYFAGPVGYATAGRESVAFDVDDPSINREEFAGGKTPPIVKESLGPGILLHGEPNAGGFLLAGTETGLGIPSPPLFLSARYDAPQGKVFLRWQNPPGGYDSISVVQEALLVELIPGGRQDYTLSDVHKAARIAVIGNRKYIPSNAGIVRVNIRFQEETTEIPYTAGVMPNWTPWSMPNTEGTIVLEQREETARVRELPEASGSPPLIEDIDYHQWIAAVNGSATGGLYRKFLDLVPGRTYRIHAKMNTGQMPSEGEWSYSLHAAAGWPTGTDFTPQQFAGLEALPDGSKGPSAGRIVEFGPTDLTGGEWQKITTGRRSVPGQPISDVTLPEGISELVVWIRYSGRATPGVLFDELILEDRDWQYGKPTKPGVDLNVRFKNPKDAERNR